MLSSPRPEISGKPLTSSTSENTNHSSSTPLKKQPARSSPKRIVSTDVSSKNKPSNELTNVTGAILFSVSKKEMFTPSNGLKGLQKRLKNIGKVSL